MSCDCTSPADKIDAHFSEQFLDVFRKIQACPFHSYADYPGLANLAHIRLSDGIMRRFRSIIEDTYLGLSTKGSQRYFVEKSVPGTLTARLAESCWWGVKEIILVRDPADWAVSVKKFFATRENVANLKEDMTLQQVLAKHYNDLDTLVKYAASRRKKAFVLKYEDLMVRNSSAIGALSDYLGIQDMDIGVLDAKLGDKHVTSTRLPVHVQLGY